MGNKIKMRKTILKIKALLLIAVLLSIFVLTVGMHTLSNNPIFSGNYLAKVSRYFVYRMDYDYFTSKNIYIRDDKNAKSIPILLYHGIINQPDETNILQENFKDQMFALKKAGWQTISIEDFYDFMRGEKQVPSKSFLLTFDDGRRDSYYPADPILKVLDYKAVMFIDTKHSISLGGNNYYLSPKELKIMLKSGRWGLQSHSKNAHSFYQIDENGKQGTYLGHKLWLADKNRLENNNEFETRIREDLISSIGDIENEFNVNVIGFAFPFGDYGQHVNNTDLVLGVSSSIFPISFYQYRLGTFTNNYPYDNKKSNFFAKRIIIDSKWNGADLIDALEKASDKELPFDDNFSKNKGWINEWGNLQFKNDSISLGSELSSSSSFIFLDGAYLWKNFIFQSDINLVRGESFSLFSRYKDVNNYVSCIFSPKYIKLEQVLNGERKILSELKGDFVFIGKNRKVGIEVYGDIVNCYLDDKIAIKGYDLDKGLDYGGIGFKTWDPQINNSELIVKNVSVEEIK